MGGVKVDKFGGMLPAWDARFLPEDQASLTRNTYLYSGACLGWRVPKLLRALTNSAAKYAYRIPTITSGIAVANLVFQQNVIEGDTVTVGEIVYKFTASPINPYDVLLGGNAIQSSQNLFEAINFGSQDITVVAAETPTNPGVASENPYVGFPFSIVGSLVTPGANTVILMPVIPTGTTKLNSVSLVAGATNAGAKFKAVVYENVNAINATGTAYTNTPTTLAATGAEVVGCVKDTTLTSVLPVPITLQGGSVYWIGFLFDSAVSIHIASLGTIGVSQPDTYSAGPLNPFVTAAISGVTTGGTTVGSLQSSFNTAQPNWQIWGNTTRISPDDAQNTLGIYDFGSGPLPYIQVQAPSFGFSYNSTPVAESTGVTRLKWLGGFVPIATAAVTNMVGGLNQSSDTTMTGVSNWLEFLDQDTDVVRTPVVNDTFQRYYFASPTQPPQYNTYNRIKAGQSPFYLGIPAPPEPPILSTISGGNPTQIGFPASTTASTYNSPGGHFSINLVLYPVISSVEVTLNSISVKTATGTFTSNVAQVLNPSLPQFGAFVFANALAPAPGAPVPNKPGLLIADSGIYVDPNNLVADTNNLIGVGGSGVTLLANTQYWIGGFISDGFPDANPYALADTKNQGYSANQVIISGGTPGLPKDPTTNAPTAPVMTPNFGDLQLWGNVTPGPAGEAQEETRAYVYTWVSEYGEEGPPSPPALLDAFDNATWKVVLQPPLSEDMGLLRNIVKTNIYRTMASVQGGTVFFFVGSVSAPTTIFMDSYTDDVVAGNLILPSTTWFGPPTTLQGMVAMPNGMIAGFRANEVWFCEPFRPHAWPSQYVMTTEYPIIGLGVVGTSLVAATSKNPNVFIGVNPSVMSQVRIPLPEPCISRGGVLSTENGVYYPSVNGLIKVTGTGAAENLTQTWISRDKWDTLTPQKFIRAVKNVSTYFAFGTTGVTNGQVDNSVSQQGFTLELSEVADRGSFTLWPQVGGHRIGFNPLTSPVGLNIDNVLSDPWSGVAFLVAGGNIYYYDFTDQLPTITPFLWRSKKFQGPHKENFAAFRVWFDVPPGGPQSPPPTRTTVPFQEHPGTVAQMAYQTGMFGVVRVIADGLYITERELRVTEELMRVAAAQKYTTWQLEIEGIVSVTNIKMTTTVKELGLMK